MTLKRNNLTMNDTKVTLKFQAQAANQQRRKQAAGQQEKHNDYKTQERHRYHGETKSELHKDEKTKSTKQTY